MNAITQPSPIHVFRTLLWEEFRSRVTVYIPLMALTGFFVLAASTLGTRHYQDMRLEAFESFVGMLTMGGLIVGVFHTGRTGYTVRLSRLHMALPVRIVYLVIPSMFFQLVASLCLGLLWGMGRHFLDVPNAFILPLLLLTPLTAQGNAAVFWCGAAGAVRGFALFLAGFALALFGGIVVSSIIPIEPAITVSLVLVAAAWPWTIVAAHYPRHQPFLRLGMARSRHIKAPNRRSEAVVPQKAPFASPFQAQCWIEFRSTAVWFLVVYLTVIVPIAAFMYSRAQMDMFELQLISQLGLGIAFATGFLWERSNRAVTRLDRVLPLSDSTTGNARIAASLAAVLIALSGIVATLAIVLAGRAMTGHPMLPPGDTLPFLLALVVSGAPVWWICLAAGRILFLLTIAPIASSIATLAILGNNMTEPIYVLAAWLPVPVTIFVLGLYARRRIGTAIPWVWLSIAIPTSAPLLVNAFYDSSSLADFNTSLLKYGYPIAMAFATLHYAWASRLITKTRCLPLGATFAMALPTLIFLLGLQPWNAGLVDRELAAYLAFGLLLPFVWFPLVVRWQRNG